MSEKQTIPKTPYIILIVSFGTSRNIVDACLDHHRVSSVLATERHGRGIHRGSPWASYDFVSSTVRGLGTSVRNAAPTTPGIEALLVFATQDFPWVLGQEQKCFELIKHRNRIRSQKSIWNSQVSLPAITPFPRLHGKHISEHIHLSSWGWLPHGCSDFLQADKGKGNHTFSWPPAVSFLLLCFVSWNGDEFSCNVQSPEEHFSLHRRLSFSRDLRRQNDLPPVQSWSGQGSSMACTA